MSNQLEKVEPHAKRLEDAADRMDKDGLGGHATRGHAAVLRDMASCMRADAAVGKMPHVYNGGGAMFGAAADSTRKPILMTPMQASMARQENVELVRQCRATCARLGYVMKENELVDVHALNKVLAGQDVATRMRLKSQLYTLHMIPA